MHVVESLFHYGTGVWGQSQRKWSCSAQKSGGSMNECRKHKKPLVGVGALIVGGL